MYFDKGESWHTGSGTPPSTKLDARSVAAHEFGHAAGIAHTQEYRCTSDVPKGDRPTMCQAGMASDSRYNDTHRRSLETDDKRAIAAQYGGSAATSSAQISHIAPQVCVDVDFFIPSPEDRAREAQALLAGTVVDVSTTLWNSDDGRYWNDANAPSAAVPYHIVTLSVDEALFDERAAFTGSSSVAVKVPLMSPIDSMECGHDSVGPFAVGQEVAVFLERGTLAWKTGKPRSFIQTVSEPRSATLIKESDGLFYEMKSVDERKEKGVDLSELRESIEELRELKNN